MGESEKENRDRPSASRPLRERASQLRRDLAIDTLDFGSARFDRGEQGIARRRWSVRCECPTSRNLVIVSMNQRDELSDELISAYFDGELSPDERAHVERLVAGSEDHRQTLAEIRSLANDMRQMPRFRLDEAFADRGD